MTRLARRPEARYRGVVGESALAPTVKAPVRTIGRYELHERIAAGGMAAVHFGRLIGPAGFSRTVAIKRLHAQHAQDPEFVAMFLDEARLAARIRHPNVISIIDVVAQEDELFLVMEYVQGESLSKLVRLSIARREMLTPAIVGAIFVNVLSGLHAAHEATDDSGRPLGIVHRDVSPQNILVGSDGIARVLDFGIAKAAGRLSQTRDGMAKGKLAYMAPEQLLEAGEVRRTTDTYAMAVCMWEALASRRLYETESDAALYGAVLKGTPREILDVAPGVPQELAAVVMRGLSQESGDRFQTAHEMATAVAAAIHPASSLAVADWVKTIANDTIAQRAATVANIECSSDARGSGDALSYVSRIGDDGSIPVHEDLGGPASAREAGAHAPSAPGARGTNRARLWLLATGTAAATLLGLALWFRGAPPAAASASATSTGPPPPEATRTAPPTAAPGARVPQGAEVPSPPAGSAAVPQEGNAAVPADLASSAPAPDAPRPASKRAAPASPAQKGIQKGPAAPRPKNADDGLFERN